MGSPLRVPPNTPVPMKPRIPAVDRSIDVMLVSEKVAPSVSVKKGETDPPTIRDAMSLIVPQDPAQNCPAKLPVAPPLKVLRVPGALPLEVVPVVKSSEVAWLASVVFVMTEPPILIWLPLPIVIAALAAEAAVRAVAPASASISFRIEKFLPAFY